MSPPPRWFDDPARVNSFLGYRWIPGALDIDQRILDAACADPVNKPYDDLVASGVAALRETFERATARHSTSTTHILPLSGGLDSRTILGGLLENVPREQIVTVTFGAPGAWDYRIGQEVADAAGVENHAVDLTPGSFPWTERRMVDAASRYDRPTSLFRGRTSLEYAFEEVLDVENFVCWSGFIGGAIGGSHLPAGESETWDEALETFQKLNLEFEDLSEPGFDPLSILPDRPAIDPQKLSYDDQLDFGVRQPYFIKPSAVFRDEVEPVFLEEPFLSFILNVPREYRVGQQLYRDLISSAYPDLFSLPTQTMGGLPIGALEYHRLARAALNRVEHEIRHRIGRERIHQGTNHFDWDVELRRSNELQQLVGQQLYDLNTRGTVDWLDLGQMYERHQTGADLGREIRLLTSLELFLKVERGASPG